MQDVINSQRYSIQTFIFLPQFSELSIKSLRDRKWSSIKIFPAWELYAKLNYVENYLNIENIILKNWYLWTMLVFEREKKESWLYQKSHTGSPSKIFNVEILHLLTNYLSIRSCDTVAVDLLEPHPWILCSAKSQRCSVRLRSGDCGWHLWTVMFMFKKLVWDHLNLVNAVLSCWMQGHEHSYQQYSGKCLHHVQLVPRVRKRVPRKHPMLLCRLCRILTPPSKCYIINIFPIFYCPILVSMYKL